MAATDGELTTKDTVALCDSVPEVPVTVKTDVPVVEALAVVTLRVDVPEPVMEVGVSVAVVPVGSPVTARLTVPVNPFWAATVAE